MVTTSEQRARIEAIRWHHSIEIEPDLVTPGRVGAPELARKLEAIGFPASFEGMSVLDMGASDGFFSFEAERRGASRVLAMDVRTGSQSGFALAHELRNSNVEFREGNVYELSPETHGQFDVVICLGLLYHLRYPVLALDRLRTITKQFMLLETLCLDDHFVLSDGKSVPLDSVDQRLRDVPLLQFYRHDEVSPGVFSNWFSPNHKALEEMLGSAGFKPSFLSRWGKRTAFRADVVDGPPEFSQARYNLDPRVPSLDPR